jgi:hypothetical protein
MVDHSGKCASRKLSCVYPTSRKPNKKTTLSSSPLSTETSDPTRPTLVSNDFADKETQPILLATHEASQTNEITPSPTSLVMPPGGVATNATTSSEQQPGITQPFMSVLPDGQSQPFSIDISGTASQVHRFCFLARTWKGLTR